jgi:hypothetical protein
MLLVGSQIYPEDGSDNFLRNVWLILSYPLS